MYMRIYSLGTVEYLYFVKKKKIIIMKLDVYPCNNSIHLYGCQIAISTCSMLEMVCCDTIFCGFKYLCTSWLCTIIGYSLLLLSQYNIEKLGYVQAYNITLGRKHISIVCIDKT